VTEDSEGKKMLLIYNLTDAERIFSTRLDDYRELRLKRLNSESVDTAGSHHDFFKSTSDEKLHLSDSKLEMRILPHELIRIEM
jgi:hypothetical protein